MNVKLRKAPEAMTFKLALVLAILQLGLSMPDPDPKKEYFQISNVVNIETPESGCSDEKDKKDDNICMLQMDERNCPVEPCLHLENFYFNINLQKCQPFTYKGSRGLGNRFSTFEECRMKCGPSLEPTTTATTVPTTPTGCPNDFVMTTGSRKCFKMFLDVSRSWDENKEKCKTERLSMAHPSDNVAVALRKDLFNRYGRDGDAWLGARGTDNGSQFQWVDDGSILASTNKLWGGWLDGTKPTGPGACLMLNLKEADINNYPDAPYVSQDCNAQQKRFTLCETG